MSGTVIIIILVLGGILALPALVFGGIGKLAQAHNNHTRNSERKRQALRSQQDWDHKKAEIDRHNAEVTQVIAAIMPDWPKLIEEIASLHPELNIAHAELLSATRRDWEHSKGLISKPLYRASCEYTSTEIATEKAKAKERAENSRSAAMRNIPEYLRLADLVDELPTRNHSLYTDKYIGRLHIGSIKDDDIALLPQKRDRIVGQPFTVDVTARFEHQWVIAPSGTGKTTLLQTQIVEDLERVQRGECSIIVIDSQNQLIPKIAGLKLFAPGEPLEGKLVVIEPDPDYPPALNVLDIGLSELSTRDRYRMQAEALENVKSCLSTMADTQDDMLSYIVELCFVIPGATIQTIVDILKPNGIDAYRQYLDDVDQTCRDYFETTFTPRSQGTNVTKEALTRRLMGMLRNPTFRRMFLNERGKFNMAKELETSKVILINTDLEFLRHDACQLFGRFFIAQLLQASEMRGERSLPVFCYIDECQDYIANDDNAAKLMDKARKRKVGMIFAHQRMQNIESANVKDALANVGVRFAGGNETDANALSKIFRCEPEFIADKARGTFACYVRRQTQEAVEVRVPPDALESMPRMTDEEYAEIRAEMRTRYAAPAEQHPVRRPAAAVPPSPPPEEEPLPKAPRTQRPRKAKAEPEERTTPQGNWQP